jgi:predicted HTH transcriptional regulator
LIGIGDDGSAIGWGPEKPLDRITDIITDLVKETPAFEVSEVGVEKRPVVVVRVHPSPTEHRPHLVRGRAMIRVNATTRRATPAELRRLLAADPGGNGLPTRRF